MIIMTRMPKWGGGGDQYKIRFQMWVVFFHKLHIHYIVIDHEGLKNKMPNTKK
jgi:hypothetical protein